MIKNTINNGNSHTNTFSKNIEIEIVTPLFAPALSPNKAMKQMQIQDLKKCYSENVYDILEHIDRAFDRDSECNALIPASTISGALREQYQEYSSIIVRGTIIFSKDYIRIGTKKAGSSLMNYEYLIASAKTNAVLTFTQNVKLPILLHIGARKNKGYGLVKISQA